MVFDKEMFKPIDHKESQQLNCERVKLKEILNSYFASAEYDVRILSYSDDERAKIDLALSNIRNPILIGIGKGAAYLERIKNYKRKYLISPLYNSTFNLFAERDDISDYDANNTMCYFGGTPLDKALAFAFRNYYYQTHCEKSNKPLNLTRTLETIGISENFFY